MNSIKKTELLLHIGFPKTATTTIQEELLYKAHLHDKLNYLGCLRFSDKSEFSDYSGKYRSAYLDGNKAAFNTLHGLLKNKKLNVLSDEKFLLPHYYLKLQHGSGTNFFSFFQDIIPSLKENTDLKILITLRNQPDLIYSQFIQKFHLLYNQHRLKSFSEFIKLLDDENSLLDSYNFLTLHKYLLNYFSEDSIHYVLFEDLQTRNTEAIKRLATLLKLDESEVNEAFKKNFRKRDANTNRITCSVKDSFLSNFLGEYTYKPSSVIRKIKNRMFYSRNIEVNKPTKGELNFIKQKFSSTNSDFFKENHQIKSPNILEKYIL